MNRDAYYGSAVSFYEKFFSVFGVSETIDFFGQRHTAAGKNDRLIKTRLLSFFPIEYHLKTTRPPFPRQSLVSAQTFMREMTELGKNCLPREMADATFQTGI